MEEMTLRAAIEVLIKRKKLIIAVPILFMLASYIFLKLFAVPIYEAESVISISSEYYDDMIKSIIQELPETEETVLIASLKRMTNFFEEKYNLLG